MAFDYKIVPAPVKGVRKKGLKTPEARFAAVLEDAINAQAAEGWEFHGTEALPVQERKGLAGTRTITRHMLVFRRARAEAEAQAAAPLTATAPAPATDLPSLSARREDPAIARPVRNLFAEHDRDTDRDEGGRD